MSIDAKPWPGGGAASVPDASETVKGIIEIADSVESAISMTPLTVSLASGTEAPPPLGGNGFASILISHLTRWLRR